MIKRVCLVIIILTLNSSLNSNIYKSHNTHMNWSMIVEASLFLETLREIDRLKLIDRSKLTKLITTLLKFSNFLHLNYVKIIWSS